MTTYQKVSFKWSTRESGVTFVLLSGLNWTRSCCAANWDFLMLRKMGPIQKPSKIWSPSIGWTKSHAKDGSHRLCRVTMQVGFTTNVRLEEHWGSNARAKISRRWLKLLFSSFFGNNTCQNINLIAEMIEQTNKNIKNRSKNFGSKFYLDR